MLSLLLIVLRLVILLAQNGTIDWSMFNTVDKSDMQSITLDAQNPILSGSATGLQPMNPTMGGQPMNPMMQQMGMFPGMNPMMQQQMGMFPGMNPMMQQQMGMYPGMNPMMPQMNMGNQAMNPMFAGMNPMMPMGQFPGMGMPGMQPTGGLGGATMGLQPKNASMSSFSIDLFFYSFNRQRR
jgi:hypothetical protein